MNTKYMHLFPLITRLNKVIITQVRSNSIYVPELQRYVGHLRYCLIY